MALLLTPAYWLCAVLLAALAVCWAYVLVQPGMLLAPAQAWVRGAYRGRKAVTSACAEIDRLEKRLGERQELDGTQFAQLGMLRVAVQELSDIDARWWWKPLWGCPSCVSGQAGFWGYLLLFPLASYSLLAHLGFAALTLLFAAIWRAIYACSQSL